MSISVKDPVDGSSVPFLRGILTRSLQQAGLNFDDAYGTADKIKGDLDPDGEITASELALIVAEQLRKDGHDEIAVRYAEEKGPTPYISVLDRDSQPQPFSKSRLAQSLEICALDSARTFDITARLERIINKRGKQEVTSDEIIKLTHRYLTKNESEEIARRYAVWLEFSRSSRPLILLIGGTTGSGKSTIGSEIAHRLNIIRTQSTDMLREVMRLMIPEQLIPALHASSFQAWKTLPTANSDQKRPAPHDLEQGYLIQSSQVGVAIDGVVRRAQTERVSLILEGIHVYPGIQERLESRPEAIVVPMVLAVLKKKQLRKQLKGRGHQVTTRRAERYLDHFDDIWHLQSLLLNEADRFDIPIIPNIKQEETIKLIMDTIVERLSAEFPGKVENVLAKTDPKRLRL